MEPNYCENCGTKIDKNTKFCPNCGEKIKSNTETNSSEIKSNEPKKQIICPSCNSTDVNTQTTTEKMKTGVLLVLLYVFLALSIIGIPLIIVIALKRSKKSVSTTICECQNCGKSFTQKQIIKNPTNKSSESKKVVLVSILACLVLLVIIIGGLYSGDKEFVDFSEYAELNPQTLYNDYVDNEISAKSIYPENYYYFTGAIFDIKQFLNSNYLVIRYTSEREPYKVIDIDAYFNSANDIINLKKGDVVTIYGKFKERTIENYKGTITSFSFHSCRIK